MRAVSGRLVETGRGRSVLERLVEAEHWSLLAKNEVSELRCWLPRESSDLSGNAKEITLLVATLLLRWTVVGARSVAGGRRLLMLVRCWE